MREIHCDICGKLVATLESGSKLQRGAVMLCRECDGEAETPEWKTDSCEVVDDLFKMFGGFKK